MSAQECVRIDAQGGPVHSYGPRCVETRHGQRVIKPQAARESPHAHREHAPPPAFARGRHRVLGALSACRGVSRCSQGAHRRSSHRRTSRSPSLLAGARIRLQEAPVNPQRGVRACCTRTQAQRVHTHSHLSRSRRSRSFPSGQQRRPSPPQASSATPGWLPTTSGSRPSRKWTCCRERTRRQRADAPGLGLRT